MPFHSFKPIYAKAKHINSGWSFVVDVNDHIGYRLYTEGSYDDEMLLVADFLSFKDTDIYIDIGANIGSTVIPISVRFNVLTFAFEMDNSIFAMLAKNCVGLTNPPICIPMGLSDIEFSSHTKAPVFSSPGNNGATSLSVSWMEGECSSMCNLAKLDDFHNFIDWNNVSLCKIDVEGSEFSVLSGASNLLLSQAIIFVEVKLRGISEFDHKRDLVLDLLQERGLFARFDKVLERFVVVKRADIGNTIFSIPFGHQLCVETI
jgi:FkbM family methyltransferase